MNEKVADAGRVRMQEILGDKFERIISNLENPSEDLAKYVVEIVYGEFYARAGLNDRYREIAAVSCLIGQGAIGPPLRSHFEGMLNVGHSREEIIELLLFLIPFIGFPKIIDAMRLVNGLFKDIDARAGERKK